MSKKPESWGTVDSFIWPKITAKLVREQHTENVDLKATRDRQAAMLRRLEEREAELDAEIGHLRRENEWLREALAWAYNLRHLRGHSDPVVIPERFAPLINAALRGEEAGS